MPTQVPKTKATPQVPKSKKQSIAQKMMRKKGSGNAYTTFLTAKK